MSDYPAQQQLVAALLDPRRYPHAAKNVRLVETHISWILLAGRYAYKIKKALDLGFLDFTGLQARQHYCAEEIRLNRRLAPDIYLEVVPIFGTPRHPAFADSHPDGSSPLEYAVKMRRFPAAALMDKRFTQGRITPQHIDRLATLLARFHSALPPAAPGQAYGSAASIRAAALQNFEQLQILLPEAGGMQALLADARRDSEQEYAACENFFGQRRTRGFVRECHGDLHLGNIVLIGDEPVPFDGIEFNAELRWIDVVNDIAFLHMDLLYRGQPALAFRLLNAWLEQTGDYAGMDGLRFYCAYRAMVRAKVGAIRAQQAGLPKRAQANEIAACRAHLALAVQCLAQRSPALLITHGLPGSGKTTFAQAALEKLQAIRIRSDVERKRLSGLEPHADSGGGIYGRDATQRTYAHLLQLARGLLSAGFPVIVDAAFLQRNERLQFRELAQELKLPFAIASLQASDDTLRARVAARKSRGGDASEAGIEVLEKLRTAQQALTSDERLHTVSFDEPPASGLTAVPAWRALQELLASHVD